MANTQPLGMNYRGLAWSDGELVPRLLLPDGTRAEAQAALSYFYDTNAGAWAKVSGTAAGGILVQSNGAFTVSGTVSVSNFPASQAVTGTFWQSTQPVSGPLTDTQLRASAVPVSLATAPTTPVTGTFWQATQPVSLAAAPTTPVTGTFWQATQPVSNAGTFAVQATLTAETTKVIGTVNVAASQTIAATQATAASLNATVVQGTAAAASGAWMAKITDGTNVGAVKAASTVVAATDPSLVVAQSPMRADAANLCVTNTAATGVACTLTISAAGAGLFHYISLIEIQLYATTARTGGATPVLVTTTNLPGSPVWDFDTAQALGVTIRQATQPATPIKSSAANTSTTIVAPIATTGIWRITAYYYAAP